MDSDTLKPNVRDLQRDVIDLLEQISSLMHRASTALSSDSAGKKYADFQQQVANEAHKVKNLELRMAIVAPMKAGKSTIVNAIVGQEILPSRNAAMTTLPTEIIFEARLKEPVLVLSDQILAVFQDTLLSLQRKICESGIERVREKLAQYPHLAHMPERIQAKGGICLPAKTLGRQKIISILAGLNDVVRLCSILDPLADPLQSLVDVPRISTPFWQSKSISKAELQETEQSQMLGNLVIIDTPGPNEAGENLRLQAVVTEQLRKSSMVLIVLDFTQLKNEAAEKVKKDVEKVVELRGKDSLYVLINKVDQRRDSDMKPEQVQQFVAAEFGIIDSDGMDRVFEISARRAFTSANFLLELQQQHLDVAAIEMKTARPLAQEVFGIDWEEEFEDATVEDLQQKAERLWKKSGFDPFLNGAVNALMAEAAPRCIRNALTISRICLVELRDGIKLRRSAIAQDADKLKTEIDRLKQDLGSLEECRDGLREELNTKKKGLNRGLDVTLNQLQNRSEQALQKYFLEELSQRLDQVQKLSLLNRIEKIDLEIKKFLVQPIRIPVIADVLEFVVPDSLSKALKYGVVLRGCNEIQFTTKQEAQEFADQVFFEAKQIIEGLLRRSFDDIERQLKGVQVDLNKLFKQKTRVVVQGARNRLNQTFDLDLELPPLMIEENINMVLFTPTVNVIKHDKNLLEMMIDFLRSTFGSTKSTKENNLYIVSLEQTVNQINQSIEERIKDTKRQISKYLDEDFKQQTDIFFDALDAYLKNYQDSLTQALKDQGSSLDGQLELRQCLDSFAQEVDKLLKNADVNLKFTSQLMLTR